MFGIDIYYIILVVPAMLFAMYAQLKVKRTFNKYSEVRSDSGYNGASIAQNILDKAGIYDVRIEHVGGNLTDHYDPKNKVLRLSDSVYNSSSVAALGVAAHEVGHAIQHNKSYLFLNIRNSIFPVVNIGSKLAMPMILLGVLFSYVSARSTFGISVIRFGIVLFAVVVLFQLITLPVEFDASNRALKILSTNTFLGNKETKQAKKVLNAAALTYVAAAAVALANLLRLVIRFGGRDD